LKFNLHPPFLDLDDIHRLPSLECRERGSRRVGKKVDRGAVLRGDRPLGIATRIMRVLREEDR
jgi:hypothetical protein